MQNMREERVAIYISKRLYDLVRRKVEESNGEFESVENYVEFILEELTREEEEQPLTEKEKEEIKKRLKSLGYI